MSAEDVARRRALPLDYFGRRLYEWRRHYGWSTHELARRSGVTRTYICHIELGIRSNPRLHIVECLEAVIPELRTRKLPPAATMASIGSL
jgi:predicted transcriptional regulator